MPAEPAHRAAPDWSRTCVIDDPDAGGSDAGAWATEIAHSPRFHAAAAGFCAVFAAASCPPAAELDGFAAIERTSLND